jgi:hypothetical protein
MALLQKGYLGATPLFRNEDWFEDTAPQIIDTQGGVTITANSSANTKGSWTQLIASTSADASLLTVLVGSVQIGATNTATLVDLAMGASGSEVAFASDIAVGGASGGGGGSRAAAYFQIPLKIPSGTRISARIQSVVTGGKTAAVALYTQDAGDYSTAPTSVDVIGGNTANSQGISFSGASATWVQATASTSQAYRAVALVGSVHDAGVSPAITPTLTLGVGASGSEVEFGNLRYEFDTAERASLREPYNTLFGRNIPAGSRLAVKHTIAADPSKFGFCLIGIP